MVYRIEKVKPHYLLLKEVSVVAGAEQKYDVTFSDTMRIADLYFVNSSTANTKKVTVSIQFEDEVITHEEIPLYLFDIDNEQREKIQVNVRNGEKMTIAFSNDDSNDLTGYLIAVIEK